MAQNQLNIATLRQVLKEELKPIEKRLDAVEKRLDGVDKRLDSLEGRLTEIEKTVKAHTKELKYLRKTSNAIIAYFEKEDQKLEKRVAKIEAHLGFA